MDADLAQDVLDSLSAHVAVLNDEGIVVSVNEAWRRFARACGAPSADGFLGESYVAASAVAARSGDAYAKAVLDGIGALIRGERTTFAIDYPCHGPGEERWFRIDGTRFVRDGKTYVVTAHHDITARKLAEDRVRESEAMLQQVLLREQLRARTDDLTGLFNRRHFLEVSEHLVSVAHRYRSPLAVLIFDIDHFKDINDTHGHYTGDRVIEAVARIVRRNMREADVLGRYGGEEFVATLPNTKIAQALAAAEHVRETIATQCGRESNADLRVTISVGIAELLPRETLEQLVQRADRALYAAKSAGRNCCRASAPLAASA